MKKVKAICLALLLIISASYLFVEVNTLANKDEFSELYVQAPEIDEDNYCRVFYRNDYHAKVLYATDETTFMCYFYKESLYDGWSLNCCKVLWSKYGSASEFSYPFYPVKDIGSYFV